MKEKELKKISISEAETLYLMTLVRWKYEADMKKKLHLSSTPGNYEELAKILTPFSSTLPEKYPVDYPPDSNWPGGLTVGADQLKDMFRVESGKPQKKYLVDTCYLYLFGELRRQFLEDEEKAEPEAKTLYNIIHAESFLSRVQILKSANQKLADDKEELKNANEKLHRATIALEESQATANDAEEQNKKLHESVINLTRQNKELAKLQEDSRKERKAVSGSLFAVLSFLIGSLVLLIGGCYYFFTLEKDYHLQPYAPTEAEKNLLAGVWEVYSPSPQARSSQPAEQTYHKVVLNVMQITKKPGFDYLVFHRHGPGFDQKGRIEFKSPNVVDIYAETVNDSGIVISPKHTTLLLEKDQPFLTALSLTWNFDKQNRPIATREIYLKKGDAGSLWVSKNPVADFMSRERDAFWKHDNRVDTIRLQNVFLDSLPEPLQQLLDENSILLRIPGEIQIISRNDSAGKVLSETFRKQQAKLP